MLIIRHTLSSKGTFAYHRKSSAIISVRNQQQPRALGYILGFLAKITMYVSLPEVPTELLSASKKSS